MKNQLFFIFVMLISMTAFGQIDKSKLELKPQIAPEIPLVLKPDSSKVADLSEIKENVKFPCNDSENEHCRDSMERFIRQNLRWPTIARENCVEGTVVISVIVEKDGSLTNLKVVRDIGAGFGEEAIKIVQKFPKLIPAKNYDNEPIRVNINIPIRFSSFY
jgi:TonB family protein